MRRGLPEVSAVYVAVGAQVLRDFADGSEVNWFGNADAFADGPSDPFGAPPRALPRCASSGVTSNLKTLKIGDSRGIARCKWRPLPMMIREWTNPPTSASGRAASGRANV
jgi:hypothetical protein